MKVLTGIETRLFGYAGYYPHAALAPYVKGAFPSYLRSKGYRTAAYISWPGRYFNARVAFLKYGFETVLDPADLGVADPFAVMGREDLDQEMAKATILSMQAESPDRPLFGFVALTENHGPHSCRHFTSQDQFDTMFRGTDDFARNCALNEYIRRLGSTARAFELLQTFLERRQAETGRPFVLLGYGDHQPYTFTGTAAGENDYTAFRVQPNLTDTLLAADSSIHGAFQCCLKDPLPVALIPSILSVYVARETRDLYLPVNFYLHANCGSDFLAQNTPCADALKRALPSLQEAGIF